MKIKSYNLFLESKRYDISKEEENIIKKYFYDRLDGEVIEGKEIDEDTSDDYFRNQPINTFKFSKSWYLYLKKRMAPFLLEFLNYIHLDHFYLKKIIFQIIQQL